MLLRAVALAILASLGLMPLHSQQPLTETIQARSRLVQMSVIVRDSKGHPVRDLAQSDFIVLDEGRPVKINTVQLLDDNPGNAKPKDANPSRPLTLSNQSPTTTDQSSNVTVILLDELNMKSTEDLLYAKRELLKALNELTGNDRVAIYTLAGPTVKIIHEFSDATEALRHLTKSGPSAVGLWLQSPGASFDYGGTQRIRNEWTISAFESIALHLADIPGRKTLIWISSAFPINPGFLHITGLSNGVSTDPATSKADLDPYYFRLKRLGRTLSNVDIAVYPVDPRGLAGEDQYQVSNRPAIDNNGRVTKTENAAGEFQTMDLIAAETGGRDFYNANALAESIRMSYDDARVSYLIWFYPDDSSWDGKTHKLEVKVDRQHVEIRSRHSYFASDTRVESVAERDAGLQSAASSALNATAISLTVNVPSNPLRPGVQHLEFSPDPKDIYFESAAGKWTADFDLVVTQHSFDGARLAGERNRCLVDRQTSAEAKTKPLSIARDITVDKNASILRILVRDSLTGAVGSLEVPVETQTKGKGKSR